MTIGYWTKNTGVGSRFLLQGIFLTQGSNLRFMFPALMGGFFTTRYQKATWEVLFLVLVLGKLQLATILSCLQNINTELTRRRRLYKIVQTVWEDANIIDPMCGRIVGKLGISDCQRSKSLT